MDQLKWGVIGTIEKAKAFANDLPYAQEEHILTAIMSDEDNTPNASETNGLHLYTDLLEFLQSDIDAVYVASPYHMHFAHVKQCLLHHKPVLCERPITEDGEELKYLMNLAENNNTFMMEAMWLRFMPGIKKVLGIISSGIIGEIVSIKASVNYDTTATTSQNISSDERDILIELGTYPVFLCVLFLGKPDYVEGTSNITNKGSNEFFSAFLSYNESHYAFIEASSLNRGDSYVIIEGENGRVVIKNPWRPKPEDIEISFFDGTKTVQPVEWEGSGFQFEVDEVYKSLKEGYIESQLYCHHFNLDVIQTMDELRLKLK